MSVFPKTVLYRHQFQASKKGEKGTQWVQAVDSWHNLKTLKDCAGDFPGGSVVKNPPSNAEDAGSIPGQGTKIPRATGQLSPCVCHNY